MANCDSAPPMISSSAWEEECSIVLQSVAWQILECLELGDNCSGIVAILVCPVLVAVAVVVLVLSVVYSVFHSSRDLRGGSRPTELLVFSLFSLLIPCLFRH